MKRMRYRAIHIYKECFVILILLVSYSFSFNQTDKEADIKAAFIVNFTKYVEWQNNSLENSNSFKIAVLADKQIYHSLQSLSSKKIKDMKIEVKLYASESEIEECHLLYVSPNLSLSQLRASTKSSFVRNALIVGDHKDALTNGAAINFVIVGDQLKFEINIQNFNKHKLKVSSQLLQLATNVYE